MALSFILIPWPDAECPDYKRSLADVQKRQGAVLSSQLRIPSETPNPTIPCVFRGFVIAFQPNRVN